jgi:predicted transcriptional regulator
MERRMIRIETVNDGVAIYKALSSEIRVRIISLLAEYKELNMNELSEKLGIPNSTLTTHIRLLDECGFLEIRGIDGNRGMQKLCSLNESRLLIDVFESTAKHNRMHYALPIGSFTDCVITTPCGLAEPAAIIGEKDNSVYFDAPERLNAGLIWFSGGYIEYPIPNYLPKGTRMIEMQISMEIASHIPHTKAEDRPMGVMFSLNQIAVGSWTVPLDADNYRSLYTPSWWEKSLIQSGKIKLLTINQKGAFIDGNNLVSGLTIDQLDIHPGKRLRLRITSQGGGVTLFGRGFGNYNQDITVTILYEAAGA